MDKPPSLCPSLLCNTDISSTLSTFLTDITVDLYLAPYLPKVVTELTHCPGTGEIHPCCVLCSTVPRKPDERDDPKSNCSSAPATCEVVPDLPQEGSHMHPWTQPPSTTPFGKCCAGALSCVFLFPRCAGLASASPVLLLDMTITASLSRLQPASLSIKSTSLSGEKSRLANFQPCHATPCTRLVQRLATCYPIHSIRHINFLHSPPPSPVGLSGFQGFLNPRTVSFPGPWASARLPGRVMTIKPHKPNWGRGFPCLLLLTQQGSKEACEMAGLASCPTERHRRCSLSM